jgi:ATP-dependent Clp protease adaptor protein ClpS
MQGSDNMAEKKQNKEFPVIDEQQDVEGRGKNSLILHNDEVNTFDFVIESLIEVCKHTTEQAEQCTYLVHYKGKCDVKSGNFDFLRPMRHALVERGLKATIE